MPYSKNKSESYTNFGGINTRASNYVQTPNEVLKLTNLDLSKPGSWTKVPGTTLAIGATVSGRVTGVFQFSRLSGASFLIAGANTNLYSVIPGAWNPIRSGLRDSALIDFVPFVDRLFCANGQDFFKTDGTASSLFSLPPGDIGFSLATTGTGFGGTYSYAYGFLNDRGYVGPAGAPQTIDFVNKSVVIGGFTTPVDYGATAVVVFRSDDGLTPLYQIGTCPLGGTFIDTGLTLGIAAVDHLWFTLAPRYLELYNNQLFMSGFSSMLSTVYFSDIGEPEGVGVTATFEVRTNDGDRVVGMKNYNGLMIFKENSFHVLSGDNPQNFTLREISDQYGSVSNRAVTAFEDNVLFLDRSGVIQFNGANTDLISHRVDSVFQRMNVAAAKDQAAMLHVKERHEVWTLIPVDGATLNNHMVIYDYVADGWYEREGLDISSLALVRADYPYPSPFYGGYTGALFKFGASLFGDNGAGITCTVKSRFHSPLGFSTEHLFRQLFLDVDPTPEATGGTVAIQVDFFANSGVTTPVLTREMFGATWQTRIDYGISAKSIAYEFSHASESQPLRINGYTFAYRFQRNV